MATASLHATELTAASARWNESGLSDAGWAVIAIIARARSHRRALASSCGWLASFAKHGLGGTTEIQKEIIARGLGL